jgi:glycosyltransferase involved in cell wall biosynthesis
MPTVSICIPTYNRKEFLKETLESVFAQTYEDYEVVIVDDGSTDGTDGMIKDAGYNLRYHWQQNQGEPAARNSLVELARGRYISFLDSDDLLFPDSIERLVTAAEAEPDDVVVYGPYIRIDENGNVCGRCTRKLYSGYITRYLFSDIFVHPNGSLFPKKVFEAVGDFDTSLKVGDYDYELRASLKYRFIALHEPTFKRRRHSSNISRRSFESCKMQLNMLENFYYNLGGKDVIPQRWAMRRLSKEGYRTGRCAAEQGMARTACQLNRFSLPETFSLKARHIFRMPEPVCPLPFVHPHSVKVC